MYDIYFDLNDMHQTVDEDIDNNSCKADIQIELDFTGFDISIDSDKKKNSNGCVCLKCNELYPYSEPNQKDGTFKCYSCRIS